MHSEATHKTPNHGGRIPTIFPINSKVDICLVEEFLIGEFFVTEASMGVLTLSHKLKQISVQIAGVLVMIVSNHCLIIYVNWFTFL